MFGIKTSYAVIAILCLAAFFMVILCYGNPVSAKTIVVPDDYSEVQVAISNAQDGDIIRIHDGSYEAKAYVTKSITIIGNGTGTRIRAGPGSYPFYAFKIGADYVNVSNLYIFTWGSSTAGIDIISSNCRIENVTCTKLSRGIKIDGGHNNSIRNCNLTENWVGIGLYNGASNNHIFNVSCNKNVDNAEIDYGPHSNRLENSSFDNSGDRGIRFYEAGVNNTIINCTVDNNLNYGISDSRSGGLNIVNVSVVKTREWGGLRCWDSAYIYVVDSIFGNSDGSGIYLVRVGDVLIDGIEIFDTGLNALSIHGSNRAMVVNSTFQTSIFYGISIESSSNITIVNVSVRDNQYGIRIRTSYNYSVRACEIFNNTGSGLWILDPVILDTPNYIIRNNIDGNGFIDPHNQSAIRIRGYVHNLTIDNNTLVNNSIGILFNSTYSGKMLVSANHFINCTEFAIRYLRSVTPNQYHHNTYVNNKVNVIGPHVEDEFDDGMEGNFWDDYTLRYPNANRIGKIWDTPYEVVVSTGVFDRYPLSIAVDFIPPVAEAGENQVLPQNSTVQFDARGSIDNIMIVNYSWAFGYDGESLEGYGALFNFTFDLVGTYIITLTVTDLAGNSDNDFLILSIVDTISPSVDAGENIFAGAGEEFVLDASGSWDHVGIINYTWTLDPGGLNVTLQGISAKYIISLPGTYLVTLNVSDRAENWNTTTILVTVLDNVAPIAQAGADLTVDQGSTVMFDGGNSTDNVGIIEWVWSFVYNGAPYSLLGVETSFTFDIVGTYEVTLIVNDASDLRDSDTLLLVVRDIQSPMAEAGGSITVDQGEEVLFDGTASSDNEGVVGFKWSFEVNGDPVELTGALVRYTFDVVGSYLVTLTVADAEGNNGLDSITVNVMDVTSPIAVAGPPIDVDLGETFSFDASSSTDNVGIVKYEWTVSIGGIPQTYEGVRPQLSISEVGIFEFTLMASDARGNTASDFVIVTVFDTVLPLAVLGADVELIQGSILHLDGSASYDNIGIVQFEWSLTTSGETELLYGEQVDFNCKVPTEYQVVLKVLDDAGNMDEATMKVTVLPLVITWDLGPFLDTKNNEVDGVSITVVIDGTTYLGNTSQDGVASFEVVRYDLIDQARITDKKKGWKTLEFSLTLDENHEPTEPLPTMERKKVDESGLPFGILAIVSIGMVLVPLLRGRRELSFIRGDRT